ncbi:MAG: hypothetical protein ACYCWW_18175 [Deltaproteobacteria bacterium]
MVGADPIARLLDTAPALVRSFFAEAHAALPPSAGAALAVVGLIVAALGSRSQVRRVVTGAAGALLGLLLAGQLAPLIHVPFGSLRIGLAVGLAAVGAWAPEMPAFLGLGLVFGWTGTTFFPPADRLATFVPGFLLGGVIGAFFTPGLLVLVTGLGGGLAFALGVAAALGKTGAWFWAQPLALLGLGAAIGAAGIATQLSLPTEADRRKSLADRIKVREIRKANQARDARFREYGNRSKR